MEERVDVRRREAFERLWVYRQVYAYRSPYDSEPVLSIEAAVAYGELLLRLNRSKRHWARQVA
jgi:hypothetical protein